MRCLGVEIYKYIFVYLIHSSGYLRKFELYIIKCSMVHMIILMKYEIFKLNFNNYTYFLVICGKRIMRIQNNNL